MEKYMISVDWLQVYCLLPVDFHFTMNRPIAGRSRTFSVSQAEIHTAMFKEVYKIYVGTLECAIVQKSPRSCKLNPRMALLKIDNRFLYQAGFIELLYDIMSTFGFIYKGITRIDICYDCELYRNGRSPSKFINNFLVNRSITAHNIRRKGSEEFTCHGKKPRGGESKINYIRFGSPQSKINSYIYDKSLELEEAHDKPWIRAAWEKVGLGIGDRHVFRSEISIKAEGTDLLDIDTGQLFRLSPEWLECQEKVELIFYIYSRKYFDFRVDGGQKSKKDMKKIDLFELSKTTTIKPIQLNTSADTGRIEKICYNTLDRLSETYTDLSEHRRRCLLGAMEFLSEVSGKKQAIITAQRTESYLKGLKGRAFYDAMDVQLFEAWYETNKSRQALLE